MCYRRRSRSTPRSADDQGGEEGTRARSRDRTAEGSPSRDADATAADRPREDHERTSLYRQTRRPIEKIAKTPKRTEPDEHPERRRSSRRATAHLRTDRDGECRERDQRESNGCGSKTLLLPARSESRSEQDRGEPPQGSRRSRRGSPGSRPHDGRYRMRCGRQSVQRLAHVLLVRLVFPSNQRTRLSPSKISRCVAMRSRNQRRG